MLHRCGLVLLVVVMLWPLRAHAGDCNTNSIGVGITPTIDGEPVVEALPGDEVVYRVSIFTPPEFPGFVPCPVVGGQLSLTLPNGLLVPLAGLEGTPDVPIIDPDTPFVMLSPVSYVVNAGDVVDGELSARMDYGSTAARPEQEFGTFLSNPPLQTASASASIALPIEIGSSSWTNPAGGVFQSVLNWSSGTPGATDFARFSVSPDPKDPIYTVTFNDNVENIALDVLGASNEFITEVVFDLQGAMYETTLVSEPSLVVGNNVHLRLQDGTVVTRRGVVGTDTAALATVSVEQAAEWDADDELSIGLSGRGFLEISGSSRVECPILQIGQGLGREGTIRVFDDSELAVQFIAVLDSGAIELHENALMTAGFLGVLVLSDGSISGEGQIVGDVVNAGNIVPDPAGTGLAVFGVYEQVSQDPEFGSASGALDIAIRSSTEFGRLEVQGIAALGGGLFVEFEDGFEPAPSDTFSIVDAVVVDPLRPRFDVAVFPPLADGRFLRLQSGGGGGVAGNSSFTIVVEDLNTLFDFGDPQSLGLDGTPIDAVFGNFNDDALLDLAVVLDGTPNGSLLVLINQGTNPDGMVEFQATQFDTLLGPTPSALAVGQLDASDGIDDFLVVTDSGEDTARVLLNTDDAGGFTAGPIVPTGSMPVAVAAADFDGDADDDVVVINQGDGIAAIYQNDGAGMLGGRQDRFIGILPDDVDLDNLDNDRDIDIVVVNGEDVDGDGEGGGAAVLLNLGDGTFDEPAFLSVDRDPESVRLEDLNGDDLPEIVTTNVGGDSVSVLVNAGAPMFAGAVNIDVDADPVALVTIDLEGDGDQDLAFIAGGDGAREVQILRNDTDEVLTLVPIGAQPTADDPLIVLAGDLDGDGNDDLVTLNDSPPPLPNGPAGAGPDIASLTVELGGQVMMSIADLNGDGVVGPADLAQLLDNWGPNPGHPADFNGDGDVGPADLALLLDSWG